MDQTTTKPTSRWKWLAIVPVLLIASWSAYRWVSPAYTPPEQPVPNAYDELVKLGDKLASRTDSYAEISDQELATIAAANLPILDQARKSLRQQSTVALNWQADQTWFVDTHSKHIQALRNLARGFAAEGMHATREGNARLAIDCGLANVQLSQAASRGGLGTDWMVGAAIYYTGLMTLRDVCGQADLKECRFVLKSLPVVNEHFESPGEITPRERHFFRRINGVYLTFLTELSFSNNRAMFEEELVNKITFYQTLTDLLRFHYAIRAFQLSEARLPNKLEELAGRQLKIVPVDPFSQQDFIYQPGKDRHILYSVGPNGIDDGGVEDQQDPQQGDLQLEPREALQSGSGIRHDRPAN